MTRLDGKVILLTGAARGLGRAAARLFSERGATLALVDIRGDEIGALAGELGANAKAYPADLAKVDEIREVVGRVAADSGRIDVLVNNAAICPRIAFADATEEDWHQQFDANAKSQFFAMQAACEVMRPQGAGRIVNVISASGYFGAVASASIYSGTKGAILAFTKSVAREVVGDGITVNCFSPGTMLTEQITNLPPERQEAVRQMIPMGRFTSPEEMAVSLAFVASDECVYTTGTTFDFLGGSYMR